MRKWEYLIADDRNTMNSQPLFELNRLGQDGWELVLARNTPVGVPEYIFKREIREV
jgi:hypothetical protein